MDPRSLPDWVTQPTKVDDQEIREIYALAGLAMYMAQVLEHGLCGCLMLFDLIQVRQAKRRFLNYAHYENYVDTLEEQHFERTFGALVKGIKSSGIAVPQRLDDKLVESLTARNRLFHRFFRDHATDFVRSEGRAAMAHELKNMRVLFEETDQQLNAIATSLQTALGVSEDATNEFRAMMEKGVSDSEIRSYLREKYKHMGVRAKDRTGGSDPKLS